MLINGDSLQELKNLQSNSIDAIITDPPYEIGFMGFKRDKTGVATSKDIWMECFRILKPGGHLISFTSTRTYHRIATAIEDSGLEIRDMLDWIYNNGLPKTPNLGKFNIKFSGIHSELKPAHEPIVLARKPLSESTVLQNYLKWNVGGLNIDATRIPVDTKDKAYFNTSSEFGKQYEKEMPFSMYHTYKRSGGNSLGRFSANVAVTDSALNTKYDADGSKYFNIDVWAERFGILQFSKARKERKEFFHPSAKPLNLMMWLVSLVTKENQCVLDPFCGSGTTLVAAKMLGRNFIGIEISKEFYEITKKRLESLEKYDTHK